MKKKSMNKRKNKRIRLYVFKSNKHIYANIIDDEKKKVLTSTSTVSREIKNQVQHFKNCTNAKIVGKNIAIKLKDLGIQEIVFDRGKNIYHGQIKALADAARQEGIIF